MRAVMAVALILSLAACEDAARQGTATVPGAGREITAEQVEAERACAELTGFSSDALRNKPEETKALLQNEFNACVAAVTGGDKPALRGRTGEADTAASEP